MNIELVKDDINVIQSKINSLYNELGASSEIIDLQVAVNELRHKFDIVDETELTESNPGFVQ